MLLIFYLKTILAISPVYILNLHSVLSVHHWISLLIITDKITKIKESFQEF